MDTDGNDEPLEEEEEDEEELSTLTSTPAVTEAVPAPLAAPTKVIFTSVTMRRSLFPAHRGDTLHFTSPYSLEGRPPVEGTYTTDLPPSMRMRYKIRKAARRACLYKPLDNAGMVDATLMKPSKVEKVNLFWGNRLSDDEMAKLNPFQRVNHFPGTYFLGRKDHLLRGLMRMHRKYGQAYDFFPTTYFLPNDYGMIVSEIARDPSIIYIAKPPASSCGKGIFVFHTEAQIPVCDRDQQKSNKTGEKDGDKDGEKEEYIVQHYVQDPLLIGGRKFDLRVYVSVTCYDPLRVYVYSEGIVRFATELFTLNRASLANRFMHLTNYSIQHHSEKFQKNRDNGAGYQGTHKWSMTQLREHLESQGLDFIGMWSRIEDLIVKTLLTCEATVASKVKASCGYRETCFELYGFDVLLTSKLHPIIMEVNVWPSLNCGSQLDKRVKGMLVTDLLNLIGMQPCVWGGTTGRTLSERAVESNNPRIVSMRRNSVDSVDTASHHWLTGMQDADRTLIRSLCEEAARAGPFFRRVFPCSGGEETYCRYLDAPRYTSILGCKWVTFCEAHPLLAAALTDWLRDPPGSVMSPGLSSAVRDAMGPAIIRWGCAGNGLAVVRVHGDAKLKRRDNTRGVPDVNRAKQAPQHRASSLKGAIRTVSTT